MSIRLYVGNLPKELEKEELEAFFAGFEGETSTKLVTDRKTGKCRGFAFVTVKNDEQANQLIEQFNSKELKDCALKIEKALPRSKGKEEGAGAAPTGGGRRNNNNNKRSKRGGKSEVEAAQPDPRWASDLAKLKEMLAAQTTAS